MSILGLFASLFAVAAVIFIMVKLHQIASYLAIIARQSVAQQGTPAQNQSAPSVKPHNLAGLGQSVTNPKP